MSQKMNRKSSEAKSKMLFIFEVKGLVHYHPSRDYKSRALEVLVLPLTISTNKEVGKSLNEDAINPRGLKSTKKRFLKSRSRHSTCLGIFDILLLEEEYNAYILLDTPRKSIEYDLILITGR